MPRFRYSCQRCNEHKFFYSDSEMEEAKKNRKCNSCGSDVLRAPTGPTSNIKEFTEIGLAVSKTEQYANTDIYKQHAEFKPKE